MGVLQWFDIVSIQELNGLLHSNNNTVNHSCFQVYFRCPDLFFWSFLEEVGQLLYQDATSFLNQTKPNYKKYVHSTYYVLF